MWFAKDAFHFAWKKATGDLSLTADVAFLGAGKDPHRKACLMIRQGLDADAAYVDVAVHGDGLTSLQFREAKGAATHEVQANVAAPARVRLEKRGKYALLYLAAEGRGAAVLRGGGADRVRRAVLRRHRRLRPQQGRDRDGGVLERRADHDPPRRPAKPVLYSTLETQAMPRPTAGWCYVTPDPDRGPELAARRPDADLQQRRPDLPHPGGRAASRRRSTPASPRAATTTTASRRTARCSSSATSRRATGQSLIYTLPIAGGTPKLVTPTGPSYWHGWSPDGKTLAYCAERNGEYDVYTIPVGGGPETRLTTAKGLDDGPEYSPDGQHIYFNSDRTGRMQIWRMKADGSDQEQVTDDEFNNWFPHPSPDGRTLVFLSYEKDVTGHPEDKDVTLRRMTLADKKIDVLGRFFGGQGTINVPCWSPGRPADRVRDLPVDPVGESPAHPRTARQHPRPTSRSPPRIPSGPGRTSARACGPPGRSRRSA